MRWLIAVALLTAFPASAVTLQQDCRGPGSIGTALMDTDGTITLNIRTIPGGPLDGVVASRPGDANYARILSHVGGMQPGEKKPVPPWC
ncbi:MAG: hypothetical protein WCJ15_09660 [Alphaproteobacteria bacterium]|jgi:hypothetical protein